MLLLKKYRLQKKCGRTYTILCPQMSPIHFELLEPAFRAAGYKIEVLPNDNKQAVDVGLKYVNNDACYPSLIVVGQIMDALLSGKYDLNQTAVIISQTGGGCRASNYIGFIRRALKKAGMRTHPGHLHQLKRTGGESWFQAILRHWFCVVLYAAVFGDIFMKCVYRMRPYEAVPGTADAGSSEMGKRSCRNSYPKVILPAGNSKNSAARSFMILIPLKRWISKSHASVS